ncbi:MAG: hypothetical protein HXX11_18045 [Desulfuromonadales bacterium]|nr:hypothetical protein [Desulfuromonadales bacterium]
MNTYDAIRRSISGKTVLHAKELHVSTSLLYKWQEPSTDFTDSGAFNPLDRIEKIIKTSLELNTAREDALAPVQFLADRFNCLLIPLPEQSPTLKNMHSQLAVLVKEFSHLMEGTARAMEDGRITAEELRAIDREAAHLHHHLGLFVQIAAGVTVK